MKKFSWIFALILALSIGFIGCPAGDDDSGEGGGGGGGGGGDNAFVPDANAPVIDVTFGAGSGNTTVYFENAGGTKAGTVTYGGGTVPAGGYKYEYGTGENTNYGNAIGRFKIDLGDYRLGDYYASFKWEGLTGDVGLSGDKNTTITYTKNLLLLATDDEDEITPWKSDGDIKALVANTDFFEKNPTRDLYDGGADVPKVRSLKAYPDNQLPDGVTEPYEITTQFKLKKELSGEVYLAFYFHSGAGSYQISDFKLIPLGVAPGFVEKNPPAPPVAPPPVPASIPSTFKPISLEISLANCSDAGTADINATVPAISFAGDALTVPFTQNNQRLNVKLSAADKLAYYGNPDAKDVYVQIDCEIVGTDNENNFRYHLGKIDSGSSWNATNGPGDFPLLQWKGDPGGIAVSTAGKGILQTDANKNDPSKARADYFILQSRSANAVTVKIRSITLWVPKEPKGPTVDLSSAIAVAAIGTNNVTVTDITGGIQVVTTQGYQWAWSYFKVTLPEGKTVADYETLSYTIKGITVTPPLGDGGGYKGGYIYGFETLDEIQDIIDGKIGETSEGAGDGSQEMSSDASKTTPIADLARAHLLATVGGSATGIANMDTDYPRNIKLNTKAAPNGQTSTSVGLDQDATEFYIIFSCGGSAGYTYELKDVKLVAGLQD